MKKSFLASKRLSLDLGQESSQESFLSVGREPRKQNARSPSSDSKCFEKITDKGLNRKIRVRPLLDPLVFMSKSKNLIRIEPLQEQCTVFELKVKEINGSEDFLCRTSKVKRLGAEKTRLCRVPNFEDSVRRDLTYKDCQKLAPKDKISQRKLSKVVNFGARLYEMKNELISPSLPEFSLLNSKTFFADNKKVAETIENLGDRYRFQPTRTQPHPDPERVREPPLKDVLDSWKSLSNDEPLPLIFSPKSPFRSPIQCVLETNKCLLIDRALSPKFSPSLRSLVKTQTVNNQNPIRPPLPPLSTLVPFTTQKSLTSRAPCLVQTHKLPRFPLFIQTSRLPQPTLSPRPIRSPLITQKSLTPKTLYFNNKEFFPSRLEITQTPLTLPPHMSSKLFEVHRNTKKRVMGCK